jgi:hypothetical protein
MSPTEPPLVAVLLAVGGSLTPAQIAVSAEPIVRLRFLVDAAADQDQLAMVAESLAPTVRVDLADPDASARAVAGADAVTTFVDRLCPVVARLSGQPDSLWGRKDEQRRALRAAGVSRVASADLTDFSELHRFAAETGFPLVVKPTNGMSSRDTWLIDDERGLADLLARLPAAGPADGTRWYAEQYLVGDPPVAGCLADYVSAELFVSGGTVAAEFVTDRLALAWPCRETGLVLPSRMNAARQAAVLNCAGRALTALAVSDGAYHVEVKPTAGRADIIEVNGRLGGFIARLVDYGTGVDLGRAALRAALSQSVELRLDWRRAVLVLLFPPPAAATRIVAAPSRRELARLPGVLAVDRISIVGAPVDWRAGASAAAAELWLAGDDHDQLWSRLADTVAMLTERFAFADDTGQLVRDDWPARIGVGQLSIRSGA